MPKTQKIIAGVVYGLSRKSAVFLGDRRLFRQCCRIVPLGFRLFSMVYLWIQKPTVLRVLPSNEGVITCYSVGFGVTGKVQYLRLQSQGCLK